ncbi:hypothetical protein ACI65C_002319 [Semiaphis heraclei]
MEMGVNHPTLWSFITCLQKVQADMDRQSSNSQANRTNQCNPNHQPTGQGRPSAYQGSQDRANVNNHGNQLNPNNDRYVQKK